MTDVAALHLDALLQPPRHAVCQCEQQLLQMGLVEGTAHALHELGMCRRVTVLPLLVAQVAVDVREQVLDRVEVRAP